MPAPRDNSSQASTGTGAMCCRGAASDRGGATSALGEGYKGRRDGETGPGSPQSLMHTPAGRDRRSR